jgi:uncharacterized paraquat-inducible protein A
MENNLEDTIKKVIRTHKHNYCKACDEVYNMPYIGTQREHPNGKALFDMYNCPKCHTTISSGHTQYYVDTYYHGDWLRHTSRLYILIVDILFLKI